MKKMTKNRKEVFGKHDLSKAYSLQDACNLVKDISTTKFDASVDMCIRLGVDPRKANQMVRGTVALPHGTGKDVKVLVLCTLIRKQTQKRLEQIITGWMSTSRKLSPVGLMWT
jgi:large subunit ribosomal protein L1